MPECEPLKFWWGKLLLPEAWTQWCFLLESPLNIAIKFLNN